MVKHLPVFAIAIILLIGSSTVVRADPIVFTGAGPKDLNGDSVGPVVEPCCWLAGQFTQTPLC